MRQILLAQTVNQPVGKCLLQPAPPFDDRLCLFRQHECRLAPVAGDRLPSLTSRSI